MPALNHRAPGPIAALLEDERVTVELINDGVHLHPAALELAFRHAGAERVAFITDAMDAAGTGDGRYMLGPLEVEVSEGVARLVEGGSIAGSTLTLDRAFQRAVTVDKLPVEDAVTALSANPARLLGLSDRIGSLEPGKDADLVLLDADFALKGVMRQGEWVVAPPTALIRTGVQEAVADPHWADRRLFGMIVAPEAATGAWNRGRSARVILTVTLNTALDITYRVRSLRPHASHRVSEVVERPGGKGVNVARVLAALGHG